jgi:3-carboxy-cis,cis-muconate cycloisomerase
MAQTEVGEIREPAAPGRGGSSTLLHKRNPVGCAAALGAAVRVPALVATTLSAAVQEHERGLGNWAVEWDTLPDLCQLASGAVAAIAGVLEGFEVHTARTRANLDATCVWIHAEAVQMLFASELGNARARGGGASQPNSTW